MKKGDKLICISNRNCERLFTIGKIYLIDKVYKTKPEYYINGCDNGYSNFGNKDCLISLKEYRKQKLEKICCSK
jgi:hypothetical protein